MPNACTCGVEAGERHAIDCARKRHNMRKRVHKTARLAVYQRDGHACVQCGSTDNLSIDHIVPLKDGGTNRVSNLQTLCRDCNQRKN